MGGTRMGTDKNKSVVDNNLKVHDINNLYIGGSSNFVTGGYTNPTFTIIQLALRLAEEINKRLYI
jgi:choline dehydrogenase-like flavoprotein